MADYTFFSTIELLKNNNTIQVAFDIDALSAPAKTALNAYVNSLGLPANQTEHLLWQNVGVGILINSLSLKYYLPSLGSQTPALNLKRNSTMRDKVVEMQSLASRFPKCQLLIFARNLPSTNWIWLNTEVIQNSGNVVNTLKILPYINESDEFVPGRGTQIGIQFIADPASNATLPQSQDRLTVQGSLMLDINPMDSKKNDETEQLKSRVLVLEALLQKFGAATEAVAGTNGLVEGAGAGQQDWLLRGDRTWQNPDEFAGADLLDLPAGSLLGRGDTPGIAEPIAAPLPQSLGGLGALVSSDALYGSIALSPQTKNGWAGVQLLGNNNNHRCYFLHNPANGNLGFFDAVTGTWRLYCTSASLQANPSFQVNGTAIISKILFASAIISLPNIAAGNLHQVNLTFAGVTVNHFIIATPVVNEVVNGFWTFYVHAQVLAANTVKLTFKNDWNASLDLPDFWIRLVYFEVSNM